MGQLVGKIAPDGTFTPELAASTVAPKGGEPFQPHALVDEALEAYRRLNQAEDVRQRAVDEQIAEKRTIPGNITQGIMTGIGDAIVKTPQIISRIASYPRRAIMGGITGGLEGARNVPVIGETVGVEELGSRLAALPEDRTYEQASANRELREAARHEVYPWGAGIGDVGGAVAPLMLGRVPFTSKLRDIEYLSTRNINKGKTIYESLPFRSPARFRQVVKQSPGFNALKRGLGRTAEAGLEGAAISLLNNGDPLEAAGFTAGTQAGTSFVGDILTRKYAKLPSRVATFAANAGIMTGVLYAAGVALPGEVKDYEASHAAINKMLWGYGLGGLLAGVSARARTGATSSASVTSQYMADALGSVPRNAMQAVMVDWLQKPEAQRMDLQKKILTMYENIDKLAEGPKGTLNNLVAAFNSGKPERFYNELDRALATLEAAQ